MNRARLGVVLLTGAALAAAGLYALRVSFAEYIEFRRNSLPFLLLVDRHIADFPLLGRTDDAIRYDHTTADGTSPRRVGVVFRSALEPGVLRARYAETCRERGYEVRPETSDRADLVCRRGEEWLLLAFRDSEAGTAVRLTFEQELDG